MREMCLCVHVATGLELDRLFPSSFPYRHLPDPGRIPRCSPLLLHGPVPRHLASTCAPDDDCSLSNAFFGRNAVEYLGLRPGRGNRRRLEAFYARHKLVEPDWMKKVEMT